MYCVQTSSAVSHCGRVTNMECQENASKGIKGTADQVLCFASKVLFIIDLTQPTV